MASLKDGMPPDIGLRLSTDARTSVARTRMVGGALLIAAQVLSYLLHRREIMVSGFLAIGQGPAAASDQNTQRHDGSEFHSSEAYIARSRVNEPPMRGAPTAVRHRSTAAQRPGGRIIQNEAALPRASLHQ